MGSGTPKRKIKDSVFTNLFQDRKPVNVDIEYYHSCVDVSDTDLSRLF